MVNFCILYFFNVYYAQLVGRGMILHTYLVGAEKIFWR